MLRTQNKIYIAFMLLGGAALVVDRCVLTSSVTMPAPVAASTPHTAAPSAASALSSAETLVTLELPFPRAIPAWDPQSPIRDLFAPFSDDDAADKRRTRSPRGADAGQGTCAGLLSRHHLEAVLVQESLKIAILDGAWVRIGESVNGCVLTEVVGNKVRFRCRDGDTLLALLPRN